MPEQRVICEYSILVGGIMTEQEWLNCQNPLPMLILLRGDVSDEEKELQTGRICSNYGDLYSGAGDRISSRKLCLFIAACLQRLRSIPLDDLSEKALRAYTRYATDRGSWADFEKAYLDIQDIKVRGGSCAISHMIWLFCADSPLGAANTAGDIACTIANYVARESIAVTCADATEEDWFTWSFFGGPPDPLYQSTRAAEEKRQAELLRHIVGNPFRPMTLDPTWLFANDGAVQKLAEAIYTQWDCRLLPILADALEEAGCTSDDILSHCRSDGKHVRGCWVVDLLLKKG